ncbi:hypothetical protein LINPERHAP2_LOCUS21776, partial [Linum perenne]
KGSEDDDLRSEALETVNSEDDSYGYFSGDEIISKGKLMSSVLDLQLMGSEDAASERVVEVTREVVKRRAKSVPKSRKERELRRINWGLAEVESGTSVRHPRILGRRDMQWVACMSEGTRGVLITAWDSSVVVLQNHWEGKFCLMTLFKNVEDEFCWMLCNVYGPVYPVEKFAFLQELKDVVE